MLSKNAMLLGVGIATSAIAVGGAAILVKVPFAWPGAQTPPAVASYRVNSPVASPVILPAAKPAATAAPALQPAAAVTDPPGASSPSPSPPTALRPAFDVVRVERSGDAVIAGHAAPNAAIELRSDGQVVARTNADATGQFVVLPPTLSSGGHQLELAARTDDATAALSESVAIDVPDAVAIPRSTPAPVVANPSPKLESAPALAKPAPATGSSLSMLEPAPTPVSAPGRVHPADAPRVLRPSIRTGAARHFQSLSPPRRLAAATPGPTPVVEPKRLNGGGHH